MTHSMAKSSLLQRTSLVFLSLFAISTLISQSAMDLFASLFVATCLVLVATSSAYRSHLFRRTGFELLIGLWFLMTTVSLAWGTSWVEVPQWRKLLDFHWLILAVLVGRHLSFTGVRLRALSWHLIALSIGSLWAIFLFFWKSDPLTSHALDAFPDGTVRTGGFIGQAIVFAQLYSLWVMLPLGVLLFQFPRFSELKKTPLSFCLLIDSSLWGLLALLLSFTRGVWLSVFLTLLVLLGLRRKLWAGLAVLFGTGFLFLLTQVWPALQGRILQAFQGGDSERIWIWSANWRMFQDSPWFGVGYNHNVQLLPRYYTLIGAPPDLLVSHAHNQYLQILTGIGLAGFLFYMGFWLQVLAKSRGLARSAPRLSVQQGFAYGLFCSFVVFLLGGLFESNFEHAKMRSTLALMLGLLIWLGDQAPNSSVLSLEKAPKGSDH